MGEKQKTEERERKKERLNDGNNNGQATHGARKHAWRTQAAWAKIIFFIKQNHFQAFVLLITDSIRLRKHGPNLVPGVFTIKTIYKTKIWLLPR